MCNEGQKCLREARVCIEQPLVNLCLLGRSIVTVHSSLIWPLQPCEEVPMNSVMRYF